MENPSTKNNFSYFDLGVLIAIILFAFALYNFPLKSTSFFYDDSNSIKYNAVIRQIDIPKIFNAFNTRFLVGLSFALNYKCCALDPSGYRSVNLLIHCFNAFLVYLLIKTTLYLISARKLILFCRLEWVAILGSLIFLCHPIQTEPVNFITQRFVLMGSFFYLLTLYLYVMYQNTRHKAYMAASLAAAIAAMFCKEFVVTLPLMIALYDFYFLGALAEPWWKRCSRILPFFVIALIVPLLLLRTPSEAVGVAQIAGSSLIKGSASQGLGRHIDITRAQGSVGRRQYFLTELNVMHTYVRLLFLPFNQNFDYDYPISYVMDAKTSLSGLFLLCLIALAIVMYRSYRIISFSILWFFIALSVESSIIPIGDVITEYRLYLASVGFALLVMALIYMKQADQKKAFMVGIAILMGFSVLTFQRNKVWIDPMTLWNDTVQKSPHKARPYINRGIEHSLRGAIAKAMADFNKAVELDPKNAEAYNNRGNSYRQQGRNNQAISDFNKAIELRPNLTAAYFNRGLVYDEQDNLDQALIDYTKAIEIDPHYTYAYKNRGVIFIKKGLYGKAISDLSKAIELSPNDAEAYNDRGSAFFKQGKLYQAMSDYSKAIKIKPGYVDAFNNRNIVYKFLMRKSKN